MPTYNGEPYPGFFKDHETLNSVTMKKEVVKPTTDFKDRIRKKDDKPAGAEAFMEALKKPVKEPGPTCPIADSYTHRYGPDDKPEVGSTHMYDYAMYVYDGSNWVLMSDCESAPSGTIDLTGLSATAADGDHSFTIASSGASVSAISIADGCGFQNDGLNLTQLAEDVASMKEMLHQLLGKSSWDEAVEDAASMMAKDMADEIDKDVLNGLTESLIDLNEKTEAFNRSMKGLE